MLEAVDLRWLTAICQILIGIVTVGVVVITWWMTPRERAEKFGPYLTEHGLRAYLTNLPNGLMFGAFLILSGTSKWAFYDSEAGGVSSQLASALSTVEALVGTFFAGVLIWKAVRAA